MADPGTWYLVFSVLSTAYSIHQQNKARKKAQADADAAKGYQISVEGSALPIPIVMGRSRVGGIRVYHAVSNNYVYTSAAGQGNTFLAAVNPSVTTNQTNYDGQTGEVTVVPVVTPAYSSLDRNYSQDAPNFLYVDQVIGAAPMSTPFHAMVDDKPFNHKDYTNSIRYWLSTTGAGATPNPMTIAVGFDRTQAMFPSVAVVGATYWLNRDEPQFSGNVPESQFYTAGWLCYDIDASNQLITTRTATTNPVRQLLTYLLDTTFGRGLSVSYINLPSFRAGIVLCNRVVQNNVAVSGAYWAALGVTTRNLPLFESCLTLDTSKPYRDNIQEILDTMIGSDLVWSENRYKFKLQVPQSFAEIVFAMPTLTADNILRESVSIKLPDASSRKNFATVKFKNEHLDFQDDTVSWPPKGGVLHTTFLTEDGQIPLEQEISLSGITDPYHALARAEEFVRSSRVSTAYKFKMFMDGAQLEPGDIVQIEAPEVGISAEVIKVLEVQSDSDNTCEITAVKFQWDVLAWNAKDDEYVAARSYASSSMSQIATISYTAGASTIGYTTGSVTWTVDNSGYAPDEYTVYVASSAHVVGSVPQWQELGRASGDLRLFELPPMQSGNYVFGVSPSRGNSTGRIAVSSVYTLVAPDLDPKDTTPPPKPGAFTLASKLGVVSVTLGTAPAYTQGHGHGYTEILMSVPPATGSVRGSFQSTAGEAPATSGLGVTYRVWLRFVTKDGVTGPLSDPSDISVGQIVSGEILDGAISLTKFASGIEPITNYPGPTLPTTKSTNTISMNGKLYRWNGTAYTSVVDSVDIPAGSISAAKLAAGIQPVTVIAGTVVPTVKSTEVITVNGTLYRWSGTAYTTAVQAVDLVGKVADNQVNLSIGGANLVRDSSFEFPSGTPWVLNGSTVVADASSPYGGKCLRITRADASNSWDYQSVPLRPSTKYRLSGWRKVVSGTAVPYNSRTLGFVTTEANLFGTSAVFAAGDWIRFDLAFTTAATVSAPTIRLYGVVGETLWDGIQLTEGETLTQYSPNPSEIAPGQVEGPHLAAGSVTADKIQAYAVVAGKVAANAITANEIAAGSIKANHLTISPNSLCLDPTFKDLTYWSPDAGGWYFDNDHANMGASRCAVLFSGLPATNPGTTRKHIWSSPIQLSGSGEAYRLRCRINDASNQTIRVVARFYNSSGAAIQDISIASWANSGIGPYSVTEQIVGVAVSVAFVIYNEGGTTFATAAFVTDVNLDQAATGTLVVDGAISADKLAANSVVASKIAANAIEADKLAANSVVAGKVAAGAISADALQANIISAKHLAIGDFENLVTNNKGESLDGWLTIPGGMTAFNGTFGGYWGPRGVTSNSAFSFQSRDSFFGNVFSAKHLDRFWVRCQSLPSGGGAGSRSFSVGVSFLDAGLSIVGYSAAAVRAAGVVGLATREGVAEAPAGTAFARVWVQVDGPSNQVYTGDSNFFYATNLEVRRQNSGQLIVDGSITASKLLVTGGGGTINGDPMFVDPSAWTLQGAGTLFGSGTVLAGAAGSTFISNSVGGSDAKVQTARFPIDPTKVYSLTANVVAGAGNNRHMYIYVRMYTAAGVEISGATTGWGGSFAGYVFGGFPSISTWSKVGGQFGTAARPIPANAAFMEVGTWFQYSGTGDSNIEQACQGLRLVEALTGALVVDGTITANNLAVDSVQAGKIAAGAVNAREIAAGAIRTNHLLVTSDSICPDPIFNDQAFWSGTLYDSIGWYFAVDPAAMGAARSAVLYSGSGWGSPGTNRKHIWSAAVPVSAAGEVYRLRCRMNNSSNQWVSVIARFYSATGAEVGDIQLTAPAGSGVGSYSAQWAPPAGATSVKFIVLNSGGTVYAGAAYVTDINLEQAMSGSLIVDGAVTANKISVGSLSAITANVGLLRTAASGARVELESNQIRVYDSNNLLRVRIGVF